MRAKTKREPDLTGAPGKLLAAALVAFGVIAFSAYGFATGDQPKPAASQASSNEIRTTPDNAGQRELPPPVEPSKAE